MPANLTRQGALNLTSTLDRVATVIQERFATLGIPEDVALDFAKRADLISDAVEIQAAANQPLSDPEVKGVSPTSGGTTAESPKSKDQNKPDTYYYGKSAGEVPEAFKKQWEKNEKGGDKDKDKKEASAKMAAPEFPVEPGKDETGESVDHGTAGFDANAIADDDGGPRLSQPDEGWMAGHFSQDKYHALRGKVQDGALPALNEVDAKLASLQVGSLESLQALAAACTKLAAKPKELPVDITRLPGLSPVQLRAHLDRIVAVRVELAAVQAEYEAALKRIKGLEDEEKAGMAVLKKAADEMSDKGKFLAETEKAMLTFTAYVKDIVPGPEQIISKPDPKEPDVRAGDFFGSIAKKLGAEIAEQVETIYKATQDDLTYTRRVVMGLKVVAKTASFSPEIQKQAGIVDVVVSIKEWMAGKTDALAQRFLGFVGDVSKWLRGFVERTKLVKNATAALKDAFDDAQKAIEGYMATGKTASVEEEEKEGQEKEASADNDWGFNLTE